jgi:hypothetical protein
MLLFFMIFAFLPIHPVESGFIDISDQERENIENIFNQDVTQISQDYNNTIYALHISTPECDERDEKIYLFGKYIAFCEIVLDKNGIDKL